MCTFVRKNLTSAKLVIIYDGLEIVQCLLTDADTVVLRAFYFFFSSHRVAMCIWIMIPSSQIPVHRLAQFFTFSSILSNAATTFDTVCYGQSRYGGIWKCACASSHEIWIEHTVL